MTQQLSLWQNRTTRAFLITALLAGCLAVLVKLVTFNHALAIGFTFDLVLTVPFFYLLLIRKTNIPVITAVPLSLLMLLLGFWLIPEAYQQYLELYMTFVLPVLELLVFGFMVVKLRQAGLAFKASGRQPDMYYRLQETAGDLMPFTNRIAAAVLATEAAIFYYAALAFRKVKQGQGFSYHRETALAATIGALALLVVIETIAVHLLLMQWSVLAANILSFLSLYSIFFVLSLVGAARHRPHEFKQEGLLIRFGLQETFIPYEQIAGVEKLRGDVPEEKAVAKLGLLGNFNLILRVKEPQVLNSLYGIRRSYSTLNFWADDSEAFLKACAAAIVKP
jgi:hypothetical protein